MKTKIYDSESVERQRRLEFGNRVRQLRKKLNLSREGLAERTNIPFKTIGDIERGEKMMLGAQWVVSPLADFFQLSGVTRDEFFAIVGLHTDEALADADGEWSTLLVNFYQSTIFPALVTDPLYNIHSTNAYLNALYGLDVHALGQKLHEGAGMNNIRFLFDPAFALRQKFGTRAMWRSCVSGNLFSFRVSARRYIGTPEYECLLSELQRLPDFDEVWQIVGDPEYRPRIAGIPTVFHAGTPDEMEFVVAYVFPKMFDGVERNMMIYIPATPRSAEYLHTLSGGLEQLVYHYSPRFAGGYRILRF